MRIGRYAATVLILAAAVALGSLLLEGRIGQAAARGGAAGATLAAVGAIGGMVLIARAWTKDAKTLLAALTIGILGRLVLYGAVLVYLALRTSIDETAAALTLLGCYVVFQVLEMRFVLQGIRGGGENR